MNTRPKTFVAACNFSCAGHRFHVGDEVPRSVALDVALRYGDRFVTVKRALTRPVATVTSVPSHSIPTTTTDPDGDVDNTQES